MVLFIILEVLALLYYTNTTIIAMLSP